MDQSEAMTIAGRAVEFARRAGATEAEAWISTGQSTSVRVRGGEVDERNAAETGSLTLRVFTDSRTASATTSDLEPDVLDRLATEAVALARLADPDPAAGLPDEPLPSVAGDGGLNLVDPALVEPEPRMLDDLARRADAAVGTIDRRVRSGLGATAFRWAGVTTLVNSRGTAAGYASTTCWLMAEAAEDAAGKRYEGWWMSSERHLTALEEAEAVGRAAAERARRQLGARPVSTQEVPVVWAPEVGWSLLAELSRAAGGDVRYRGQTFLIDQEGQAVASPLVTITDDAILPGRPGSRPFDAEGVASRRTPLIANGVFSGFLYDTYSARKSGTRSTANASRPDQLFAASTVTVAPSNLSLAPGETDPSAIISGVKQGLYLTGTIGHGINLSTGDFSRGAIGVWIEDGELAYPVGEVNIAGRMPEMLAAIDAVGNDPVTFAAKSAPTFRVARMMVSGR